MCGIAGFLGQFSETTLAAMSRAIANRGPDGHGTFVHREAGVGLAHRRLSIVDLSQTGAQPMTDPSGRYTISYNGEIYNYRELRAELLAAGRSFRGSSDTEVVLQLFASEGPAAFPRLNGIFALAIWDAHERALWLARDGMGVKPLYLAETSGGLVFASELKALLAVPGLDRSIDREALTAYLGYLYSPGVRTMFRSVKKLEAGSWLRIQADGRQSTGRFYTLPDYHPDQEMDAASAIAGTEAALRSAVERQMIADVEVGAFLSGGLDSTAIVTFAREHAASKMQCFTIDYRSKAAEGGELVSDLPYARRAAAHLGVQLHEVAVDSSIAHDFEQLVYILDEPQADPAAINNLKISALARANGIKVLLSGAGGDDLFTGYRRHQAAAFDRWVDRVPRAMRVPTGWAGRRLPGSGTRMRRLRKLLGPVGETTDARLLSYFEWLRLEDAASLLTDTDPSLAPGARASMQRALDECPTQDPVERALRLEQRFFLRDHNLNYTDKTGMAAGVEIRVPFLDPDLVAFAARMPTAFKLHGRETKWALRKAMEPYLPHDIIYRPKTGFGVPLRAWMADEMKPMIRDVLAPDTLRRRGLFDPAAVARLQAETDAGRVDGHYALLALATVELWCRAFVDAPAAAA